MTTSRPNKLNILLVDDSATARRHLTEMMAGMGHSPQTFSNGADALDYLKTEKPDLVICDLVMPGLDGIEVLKRSRNLHPQLPFLIITAHASLDTAVQALRTGADDYITRPVEEDILAHRIQTVMTRRRLEEEKAQRSLLEAALATVGGMSHEINQPLMAIVASAELIENMENPNRIRELARLIGAQAQRIGEITKKIDKLHKFETMNYAGRMRVLDLKASTED